MKKPDPTLPFQLAETKQRLYVTEIALREALQTARIPVLHEIHSTKEHIVFYLLQSDAPHGGVILVKQTIEQPDGHPLVSIVVQLFDEFHSQYLKREHAKVRSQWHQICSQVERKLKRAA